MNPSTGLEMPDLVDRAARLARVVAGADIVADFPFLKAVRVPPLLFGRLEAAAQVYVWHSLSRAQPDRTYTLSSTLLNDYASDVFALPNRTPNGVLLPRLETFSSFNLVHQMLGDIIESTNLLHHFSLFQIPCNVRIVSGKPDQVADARQYSSAKIHTDVWNGEPLSSILFNVPVLGDPFAADLRFYEPRRFPSELRVGLRDYALGAPVTEDALEYPAKFEMGSMYISDSLSLHRTLRVRPRLRLSLDFRCIARELLVGESSDSSTSRAIYVAPEVWRAAGAAAILASGEPLDAFQRRQAGETVTRKLPSLFDVDEAPGG